MESVVWNMILTAGIGFVGWVLRDKASEINRLQILLNRTREEIANLVGTATETAIRLLSEFNKDHIIELTGKKIKILDAHKLVKTANLYD